MSYDNLLPVLFSIGSSSDVPKFDNYNLVLGLKREMKEEVDKMKVRASILTRQTLLIYIYINLLIP